MLKFIFKLNLVFTLCAISCVVLAHDQHLTSMTLEIGKNNTGVLHVTMPQYGLEQKIGRQNPEIDLSVLKQTEFQKLVVSYLKSDIEIEQAGVPCQFTTGIIKSDGHIVKVKLGVSSILSTPDDLIVKVNSLNTVSNDQIALSVLKGQDKCRTVLSKKNGFIAKVDLKNNELKIRPMKAGFDGSDFFWLTGLMTLFGFAILIISYKRILG